jgi:hypothetical protein
MKRAAMILAAVLLSACESSPLANRVSMTLAGDEAYVNSMYGFIGVTSKIDKRDAEIMRELVRLKAMVEAVQRAQAQAQRDSKTGS